MLRCWQFWRGCSPTESEPGAFLKFIDLLDIALHSLICNCIHEFSFIKSQLQVIVYSEQQLPQKAKYILPSGTEHLVNVSRRICSQVDTRVSPVSPCCVSKIEVVFFHHSSRNYFDSEHVRVPIDPSWTLKSSSHASTEKLRPACLIGVCCLLVGLFSFNCDAHVSWWWMSD